MLTIAATVTDLPLFAGLHRGVGLDRAGTSSDAVALLRRQATAAAAAVSLLHRHGATDDGLFEEAEELLCASDGALALAPDVIRGWRTYNFEVAELHTYVADGLRVHNDSLFAASIGGAVGGFLGEQLMTGSGLDDTALRHAAAAALGGARLGYV